MLLRDDETAKLAHTLGDARAIVMRGNGCILTGATVEEAIVMAFYLEEAATTELAVMASGQEEQSQVYSDEQAKSRAVSSGQIFERMWDFLTHTEIRKETSVNRTIERPAHRHNVTIKNQTEVFAFPNIKVPASCGRSSKTNDVSLTRK